MKRTKMNWTTRLQNEINFQNCPNSALTKGDKSITSNLLSPFVSSDLGQTLKNSEIYKILNSQMAKGVNFQVSATDFTPIDRNNSLKSFDLNFLKEQKRAVLCFLQQSLLVKYLFSHSQELLEDFIFEVRERESLMTKVDESSYEIYFNAVEFVTRKWFEEDLLN